MGIDLSGHRAPIIFRVDRRVKALGAVANREYGPNVYAAMPDAALVTVLVGRDGPITATVPVADLLEMNHAQLAELGLCRTSCHRLLACAELARRFQPSIAPGSAVTTAAAAVAHLRELRGFEREAIAVLMLDSQLHPIGIKVVAEGGIAMVGASPIDIFRPAVHAGAVAVIIAHNHPSGSLVPSHDDAEFTRRIAAAGQVLQIDVVDHLIVTTRGFQSLRELQLLR